MSRYLSISTLRPHAKKICETRREGRRTSGEGQSVKSETPNQSVRQFKPRTRDSEVSSRTLSGEVDDQMSKIWERKDHNKKVEWINNMETGLRMLKESPQVNIQPKGLKTTLKKITNWKNLDLDGLHGFGF